MQLHSITLRLVGAASLLLAAGAPVAAADPAPARANEATIPAHSARPSTSGEAAKANSDEPKKICRTISQTQSRLQSTRICLTRQQWRNAKYN